MQNSSHSNIPTPKSVLNVCPWAIDRRQVNTIEGTVCTVIAEMPSVLTVLYFDLLIVAAILLPGSSSYYSAPWAEFKCSRSIYKYTHLEPHIRGNTETLRWIVIQKKKQIKNFNQIHTTQITTIFCCIFALIPISHHKDIIIIKLYITMCSLTTYITELYI